MVKKDIYDPSKFVVAKRLFVDGNYRAALENVEKYIYEFPEDLFAQVFKARLLFSLGRIDEAKELIDSVLDFVVVPKPQRYGYELLKDIAIEKGDNEELIRICNIGMEKFPLFDYKFRIALSKMYLQEDKFDEAINILDTDKYNCISLNLSRSLVYLKQNKTISALKALYRKVTEGYQGDSKDEDNIDPFIPYLKSLLLFRLGKNDAAFSNANKALKNCSPHRTLYHDILLITARLNFISGDNAKAVQLCKEIASNSNNMYNKCSAYSFLGYIYIQTGNINSLNDLSEECDDDYLKKILKIQSLFSQFKFEEALELLNETDSFLYAVYYKLLVLYRLGRKEEFMELYNAYKESKDYDPYSVTTFEIERAYFYFTQKNYGGSGTYIDKQFLNYNSDRAINHIKNNHINRNDDDEFSSDTNAVELYNYVVSNLDISHKICDGTDDKYFVKVDGKFKDKRDWPIKYVSVICFAGTKNIITMYPEYYYEPSFEITEKPKVQKLSKIDKFNQKYGLK